MPMASIHKSISSSDMTATARKTESGLTDRIAEAVNACQGKCALILVGLNNMDALSKTTPLGIQADLRDIFIASCQSVLRPNDALILAGDDQLVLVLDGLIDINHVNLAGMKLARVFASPVELTDQTFELSVFCGIVYLARQVSSLHDPQYLLDLAASALQSAIEFDDAQAAGENFHFQVTTIDQFEAVDEHWRVNQDLKRALNEHEVYIDYQPKVDLEYGDVIGAEALIRWRHQGEILPPSSFTSALHAELMWLLTQYAFRAVLRDVSGSATELPIALDLDTSCLLEPDLLHFFERETNFWGVDRNRLLFEISAGKGDFGRADRWDVIRQLRELGFRISVDDFTGDPALFEQLRTLPADEIKICGRISGDMLSAPEHAKISREVIDFARQHRIHVVGQSVEDAKTLTRLARLGCTLGQGFYLGPPTSMAQLQALTHPSD